MGKGAKRWVTVDGLAVSSRDLKYYILATDAPNLCAYVLRAFSQFKGGDPAWCEDWCPFWSAAIEEVLLMGLRAKFKQNPRLQKLLLMTGDFELVEAAKSDDRSGCGFDAGKAVNRKGQWGLNWLGKNLETVRDELRTEHFLDHDGTVPAFSFKFWRVGRDAERGALLQEEGAYEAGGKTAK